jgi:hypothetical protein
VARQRDSKLTQFGLLLSESRLKAGKEASYYSDKQECPNQRSDSRHWQAFQSVQALIPES